MERRDDAIQASIDLARWQGATDARLGQLEGGQRDLAIAISRVDTKIDSLKTWMLTAAVGCLGSALVSIATIVLR